MNKWLSLRSTVLALGLVCGLGMILCSGSTARAGNLEIIVTETGPGGAVVPIMDNFGLDTDPTIGSINVDTAPDTGINLLLANYNFRSLQANSNSPGDATSATLNQNGNVQLNAGGSGSITILASDNQYNSPTGPFGTLNSSGSATFNHATNGNPSDFQSWFNPSNSVGTKEVPSPILTFLAHSPPDPNSHSGDAAPTSVGTVVAQYGLTNQTTITLTGGAPGVPANPASDQFTGATTLTAVPEPTSMALMLAALPVWIFGVMRRRRAKAA
jgi:hypothetical protein